MKYSFRSLLHPIVLDVLVLCACLAGAIWLLLPMLRESHWLILDDASDIRDRIRPLLADPTLSTLMETDNVSRFRPVHWILRTFIYWIGGGQPAAFWHANWMILTLSLFLAYSIAKQFCTNRLAPIICPILLFLAPPLVEVQYSSSAQERWLLLFGMLLLHLMFLTDKRILGGIAPAKRWGLAVLTWMGGVLYIYSKEPATIGVFFPVVWLLLTLRRGKQTPGRKQRVIFLLVTFAVLVLVASVPFVLRTVRTWMENKEGYSGGFEISWTKMAVTHNAYRIMFFPRVWPLLLPPLMAAVLALCAVATPRRRAIVPYVAPIVFFLLISGIQYVIRLPWEAQVRYLLPIMGPLVIVNALSVDYVLAMVRKPEPTA